MTIISIIIIIVSSSSSSSSSTSSVISIAVFQEGAPRRSVSSELSGQKGYDLS